MFCTIITYSLMIHATIALDGFVVGKVDY